MKVVCIIPSPCTKKTYPNLVRSVSSLIKSARKAKVEIKIIVITYNKRVSLVNLKSKINALIRTKYVNSFAIKNNLAISYAFKKYKKLDYFLLINDDAWVETNFFKVFLSLSQIKKHEIIVPLIHKSDTSLIDSYGIEYFRSGYARNVNSIEVRSTLAAGSCVLVKASFMRIMGEKFGYYLNPILEAYYEDIEFSIRSLAYGGKIYKSRSLVAHHIGSSVYGFKSKYVFFQSARNVLWVILLSWPAKHIIKNLLAIIVVQLWFFMYGLIKFGFSFDIKLLKDTFLKLPEILKIRRTIIVNYKNNFNFKKLYKNKIFRTGKGKVI